MALNDALFQLGMDLEASTTQTEAQGPIVAANTDDRLDYFCERDGERFAGTHLIIDLIGAERLDDIAHIDKALRASVEASQATLLHIHLHHFTPNGGVSGVAVLAESHISIHTWPEADFAALDVFMCGGADPSMAIPVLEDAFSPDRVVVKELLRGRELWSDGSMNRCTMGGASV